MKKLIVLALLVALGWLPPSASRRLMLKGADRRPGQALPPPGRSSTELQQPGGRLRSEPIRPVRFSAGGRGLWPNRHATTAAPVATATTAAPVAAAVPDGTGSRSRIRTGRVNAGHSHPRSRASVRAPGPGSRPPGGPRASSMGASV